MAETLQKVIQSVLVYILIVTVLRGIVKNPRYGQYFLFFSGVILILILISPVLSLFRSEDGWYRYLEENMLQLDRNRIDSEMRIADGKWDVKLKEQYQKAIQEQILFLASEEQITLSDLTIELNQKETGWEICKIEGRAENEKEALHLQKKLANDLSISKEQVVIKG